MSKHDCYRCGFEIDSDQPSHEPEGCVVVQAREIERLRGQVELLRFVAQAEVRLEDAERWEEAGKHAAAKDAIADARRLLVRGRLASGPGGR